MRKVGCYASEQTIYCGKITNSIMCNFWITHFPLTLLPLLPSLCSLSSSCLLCCRIALFSVCAHAAVRCRSASAPALGTVCSHNIQMSTPVETQYEDKLSRWVDIVLPMNKSCEQSKSIPRHSQTSEVSGVRVTDCFHQVSNCSKATDYKDSLMTQGAVEDNAWLSCISIRRNTHIHTLKANRHISTQPPMYRPTQSQSLKQEGNRRARSASLRMRAVQLA